jgi:hypothetical protein
MVKRGLDKAKDDVDARIDRFTKEALKSDKKLDKAEASRKKESSKQEKENAKYSKLAHTTKKIDDKMTKNVKSGKIFVTAFLDFKTYKNHSQELAWETEVWIAEMPEHMIHLNGDKFLGPRKDNSAK